MKETDYFTIDNEVFINSKSNENTDESEGNKRACVKV